MNEKELEQLEMLLLEWEDDSIDDPGLSKLRQMIREHPEARQRYVELQMLRAAMHLDNNAGLGSAGIQSISLRDAVTTAAPSRSRSWVTLLVATAASLLIGLVVGRWVMVDSKLQSMQAQTQTPIVEFPRAVVRTEAKSQGVALLTRLVDVQWVAPETRSQVGEALSPGTFNIESGLAQIEFFCGATVVLQGPAELELESSTSARLFAGQLRAQVPPAARGFQIQVEEMKIVDLGTEFGISATPDGTGVQVFDGEVELHQPASETRLVTAGNAVLRDASGNLDQRAITPDKFVGLESLDTQASNQTEDRYQRWRAYSNQLREDPRLIAYYSMDGEQWNRKLQSSIVPHNLDLDGAIVGAKRVAGRWPNKNAIEFKRPGDRVRVDIPGEFESLTLACWVKIDSLDRWYNSLFLTDNYQRGEPHWQILDTGQLFFSVRVREGNVGQEHREVLSPPFWKPSMSGQWLHLATTYDVTQKRTTHFLNGAKLSEEAIPDVQLVRPTRIGQASIGNWSLPTKPDSEFAIRNLNGSIDEFALYNAALTPEEIQEIYETGKP